MRAILKEAISTHSLFLYVVILLLVAASAFFSSCETAVTTANRIRLETLAQGGSKAAKRALKLIENYDNTLSAILIGNNIVNISAASLATVAATNIAFYGGASAAEKAITFSTVLLTLIVLIFGEITPKSYAKHNAEKLLLTFSLPLSAVVFVFLPLEKLCAVLQKNDGETDVPTELEMEKILEESMDKGQLDEGETEMAKNALRLDEISAEEILVPRVDIVAVDKETEAEELVSLLIKQQFSRVPVYDETIDKIIGIVYERDVLEKLAQGEKPRLKDLIRPALFVPRTTKLSRVLTLFQQEHIHLAVVTDAFGGTVGIVTMEDIFEELVGDISDETDAVQRYIIKKGSRYEINAKMSISDLIKETDFPKKWFEGTEAATVGGWIMDLTQKIPEKNETFEFDGFKIKIKGMRGRRVMAVEIEPDRKEAAE